MGIHLLFQEQHGPIDRNSHHHIGTTNYHVAGEPLRVWSEVHQLAVESIESNVISDTDSGKTNRQHPKSRVERGSKKPLMMMMYDVRYPAVIKGGG